MFHAVDILEFRHQTARRAAQRQLKQVFAPLSEDSELHSLGLVEGKLGFIKEVTYLPLS